MAISSCLRGTPIRSGKDLSEISFNSGYKKPTIKTTLASISFHETGIFLQNKQNCSPHEDVPFYGLFVVHVHLSQM